MGTIVKIFLLLILFIAIIVFVYTVVLKKKVDKEEILYQIEEFKKSRAMVGTLCLVIALILSFVITPAFTTALNKRTKVIEITRDIKVGEKIQDNMIKEVEVGSYGLSKELVKTKSEVKDMYAVKDLYKGQYLYKSQIGKDIPYDNNYLYGLNGLKRAISFSVNKLSNGLSNKLIKGDVISIIVINQSEKDELKKAVIPEELKYIEVLTTTNDDGNDIDTVDKNKDKDDIMYQTITVLASDEQAKIIAKAETTQQIYVELVYRPGNFDISNYLLEEQEKILNNKYPERENKDIEEGIKKLLDKKAEPTVESETINPLSEINKILQEEIDNANINKIDDENDYIEEVEDTTVDEIEETTIKNETVNKANTQNNDNIKSIKEIQKEEYERIKESIKSN